MTPINKTTYRNPTPPCSQNKNASNPMNAIVDIRVSQFFAQYRISNKANTSMPETIFDAKILNPEKTINEPQKELPRYPAGSVI